MAVGSIGAPAGRMTGRTDPSAWDYAVVVVVNEEPFVSECLLEKGDEGHELVTAIPHEGSLQLFFKRPKK